MKEASAETYDPVKNLTNFKLNFYILTISALMHIAYIINAVSLKQVLFQIYTCMNGGTNHTIL